MKNITTTRQLRAALRRLQKEYGMQGWAMHAEFVHPDQIHGNDALTTWDVETMSALVQIAWPCHNRKPVLQRLHHEMSHPRLVIYPKDEMTRKLYEAGIDAIADRSYVQDVKIAVLQEQLRHRKRK